ncbi:unnamed protein product [Rotaria sp. Silwood1]|nr:unnamed protein product [Rotaria sp. Silwood1]
MTTTSMTINIDTLYDDLMSLCSQDDAFYYKDIRLHAINYRIFNHRLCSYGRFKTRTAALNSCGTMFNITNSNNVKLVSLPPERIFDYEEGFGQKQYHERGRLGDKMEKMDGALMSTFLHGRTSKEQVLRLKSKQSLTSNQVLEAMQLLVGNLDHLVPFESILPDVTQKQLLQDTYQQTHGEGYVIEIIQPDQRSYLVKIKTQKYFMVYGDGGSENSPRSLFEAIINGNADDLAALFNDDTETLKRIDEMEKKIKPKYYRMIELVEQFYQKNKHLSKRDFVRSIKMTEDMKIYLPLSTTLYEGKENDYKVFAMKHAKDLFGIGGDGNHRTTTVNQDKLE